MPAYSETSSAISRASTLIGGHAKLGGVAANRSLVSRTLAEGLRCVSASNTGGYGNAGAWGVLRRVSEEEYPAARASPWGGDARVGK